jgi:succinate dehydrogenase / fumarate reductase, membrane anchor subunit
MATRTRRDYSEATRWRRRPRPTFAWTAQVVSGVLLLVLLTVHMVAQHFVVAGGLRTYDDVISWIRNPVVLVTDVLLLVCATWHGIAGVHAVLLDLGLRGRAERIVARVLLDLGVVTVLYGLWLLYMLAFRGG